MGPIALVGFMGSGKTTVARYLANRLDLERRDLDHEIEKAAGMKIRTIFKKKGETYFRGLESRILYELPSSNYVLSLGGGAVIAEENVVSLQEKGSIVIYLKASPEIIKKRLANSYRSRPLLVGSENMDEFIAKKLKEREPVYKKVANITIKTDNLSINQVVDKIIDQLKAHGELQ